MNDADILSRMKLREKEREREMREYVCSSFSLCVRVWTNEAKTDDATNRKCTSQTQWQKEKKNSGN